MRITKNFTLDELTNSQTATLHNIDNTPGEVEIEALQQLCDNVLQPLRNATGPVFISSGFRCRQLNRIIGGSVTSQHMKGEAADIVSSDNASLFNHIRENLPFDQLIWEYGNDEQPQWVHVSYCGMIGNRGQVLQSYRENGKTLYKFI